MTASCGAQQAEQNWEADSGDPTTWLAKIASANPDLEFVGEPLLVDWSQDVWARGCYSAFDNPAADVIPILSVPVGRIFFAGEHTNRESALYVLSGHGRFLTGDDLSQALDFGPGDCLYVPPGAPHAPVNDGDEPIVLVVVRNARVEIREEYAAGSAGKKV